MPQAVRADPVWCQGWMFCPRRVGCTNLETAGLKERVVISFAAGSYELWGTINKLWGHTRQRPALDRQCPSGKILTRIHHTNNDHYERFSGPKMRTINSFQRCHKYRDSVHSCNQKESRGGCREEHGGRNRKVECGDTALRRDVCNRLRLGFIKWALS